LVRRFDLVDPYPLPHALFAMLSDPDCRVNLAEHADTYDTELHLAARLDAIFAEMADTAFDLWQGGACKSNMSRPWLWRDVWGDAWATTL